MATVRPGSTLPSPQAPSATVQLSVPPRRRRPVDLPWPAPTLLMAALAAWYLGRPALWADELASVNAAVLSWGGLRELLSETDLVLAPYYAFLHVWTAIAGTSEVAVRLPSAVAAVGTVGVTATVGARLWGHRAGVLAGLVLAVLPVFSRFAQEARGYSPAIFGFALATLLLLRWVERPGPARLAAYAVVLGVAVLLLPFGAMILAAHAVLAWPAYARWTWLVSAGAAGLPGVALFAVAASTQRAQISWIPLLGWAGKNGVVERALSVAGPIAVTATLVILGLLAVRRERRVLAMACWGLLPIGLLLAAGMVAPIWVSRYVAFTLPGLALLAASGLSRLSVRQATVVVALLAVFGAANNVIIRRPDGHTQAGRRIAEIIGPRFRPDDVAVYGDNHPSIPWSPRDIVARYLPAGQTPRDALMVSPQRTGGHFLAVECADVAGCVGAAPRIWVIRADDPSDPRDGLDGGKTSFLLATYTVSEVWRYPLLTVALLDRK
ncbi:glycosyltransferase family 39 protein [Hamadaea sp. NPDC051192]|uniref:glycosyltransferase family 39 protein n=1 Tax=Hamadaea sp. NPDC051192 TaxID=3154940 RepID=UPI0034193365